MMRIPQVKKEKKRISFFRLEFNLGKLRRRFEHFVFLIPALLVVGAVLVYPLLHTFYLSFFDYSISKGMRYAGLQNYADILVDKTFYVALQNTVIYTIIVVTTEMIYGFILANVLNRDFRGKNFIRALFMIPLLTSPIVSGLTWRLLFNPDLGFVNYFINLLGFKSQVWTGNPHLALPSIMVVDFWSGTPFVMLLLLAGLQSISKKLYEAATIDGANRFHLLRYITIPLLKPMILVVLLLRTMDSLKIFDIVYALTGGGPGISSMTVGIYAYLKGFRLFYLGYAAAISWVLAVIIILVCILYIRFINVPEQD